jgi:Mg2+/Co2+ transporter CorC
MSEDREHAEELERRLDGTMTDLVRGEEAWRRSVELIDADDPPEKLENLMSIAAGLVTVRDGIRELRADLARLYEEEAARERREWERQEAAKLNTVFSDEVVLEALRRILDESEFSDVYAGEVAAALGALPTHSDRIRAGKALRRLADAGKVRRIEAKDSHRANRWGLPGRVRRA